MLDTTDRPIHILKLDEHCYALTKQILTGQKSIVWKAWMLPLDWRRPVYPSVQELTRDHLEWLRSEQTAYGTGIALPETWLQQGRWVAIKISRSHFEDDARKEARWLDRFARIGQTGGARAIGVVADLSQETFPPILILEWAPGLPLYETPAFDEGEGLRLASQLAFFIQNAFLRSVILTDTLKAGSLFYDQGTRSLVLLDWNTVGTKADDMREVTLPILGQTFYWLFTGALVEFSRETRGFDISGIQIGPDQDAETWDRLSYGTRSLVTDLLLRKIPGDKPEAIVSNLVERVTAQQERSRREVQYLLASARQATEPADCLNDYDLALGDRVSGEDEARYRQALYDLLSGLPLIAYDTADVLLNWTRRRFPNDVATRWTWLVRRTARRDPELWDRLHPLLEDVEHPERAIDTIAPLTSPKYPELQAIQAEAQLRSQLTRCEGAPALATARELEQDIVKLREIWIGNAFVETYGDVWLNPLKERIAVCRRRAEGITHALREVEESLDRGELPALEGLKRWQAEQANADLPGLIYATESLTADELNRCMDTLFSPGFPAMQDDLVHKTWNALTQRVVRRVKEQSRTLIDEDDLQSARGLLETLDEHEKADAEAKAILWLLSQFEKARQYVANRQPSEAYRLAYWEIPAELGKQDLPPDVSADLNKWAKGTFDRMVGEDLRRASRGKSEEAERWFDNPSVGIGVALAGMAAVLEEAVRLNPGDADALQRLDIVRAFQRGRQVMLNDPVAWQVAAANLDQVSSCGWERIIEIARPYANLAYIGEILAKPKDPQGIEAQIHIIHSCSQVETSLGQLDRQIWERWNDGQLSALVEKVSDWNVQVREQAHEVLGHSIPNWLARVRQAHTALENQTDFVHWQSLLAETGVTISPGDAAGDVNLKEYLDTLFNYALAQSHLARAGAYGAGSPLARHHFKEADAALSRALQAGYRGPWPGGQPTSAGILTELHRQRQYVWTSVYDDVNRERFIVRALRQVEGHRDLDAFSRRLQEDSLCRLPENAFKILLTATDGGEESGRDEWAKAMARVPLHRGIEGLCTWENVAQLIAERKYSEALALASLTQRLRPTDQNHHPVQDAITEQGHCYGERIYHWWGGRKNRDDIRKWIPRPYGRTELEQLDREFREQGEPFDPKQSARQTVRSLNKRGQERFSEIFAQAPVAKWYELAQETIRLKHQRRSWSTRAGIVGVTLVLIIAIVAAFRLVPSLQAWGTQVWESISPGRTVEPLPGPVSSVPVAWPAGQITVGEAELREGGTQVWRQISIENTGQVSGTFDLHTSPANTPVAWTDGDGQAVSNPSVTINPGGIRAFNLTLIRPSPFEPEPAIGLTLHARWQEREIPVAMAPVLPSPEYLHITPAMSPTVWIRQNNASAPGSFTSNLDISFIYACYDAKGTRQAVSERHFSLAHQPIEFTCELVDGDAGEWHAAIFPQPAPPGEWSPPETRPEQGFPIEIAFTVRDILAGIGISENPVLLFDPGPPNPSAGVLYTLWNTGESADRFTVELKDVENVTTATLSLAVVTGITPTSDLAGQPVVTHALALTQSAAGAVSLFPLDWSVAPCPDPQGGACQIVRLAIALHTTRMVKEGDPARLTLSFRPLDGQGDPLELPIEIVEIGDKPPDWLYLH